MKNFRFYILFAGILALGYLAWRANPSRQPSDPVAEDAAFAIGQWIYDRDCASCHNAGPHNSSLRDFAGNRRDFEAILRVGPTPMPSFDGAYTDAEANAVWTYVQALSD